MKTFKTAFLSLLMTFVLAGTASAHVVVKPGDAATGTFQTFTVGVPNEKGGSVVTIKLLIPEGVTNVTPNEKPGWTIATEKTGEGEEAVTTSITWSGGAVTENRRDDFSFSAKTPDQATDLQWKAYETYDNGVTISWDKSAEEQPKKEDGSPDFSKSGPFSVTKVAAKETADTTAAATTSNGSDTTARTMAGVGIALGLLSFALVTRKQK